MVEEARELRAVLAHAVGRFRNRAMAGAWGRVRQNLLSMYFNTF